MIKKIFIVILLLLINLSSRGQCNVVSTNGYDVIISVLPTRVVTSSMSCQYGYNYNIELTYDIKFVGSNIPTGLWTLQGIVSCGSTNLFFDLPNSGGNGIVVTNSNPYNPNSDCNTATVESLFCNNITIDICGPGITNQTITCPSNPLPIELIEFSGIEYDTSILINWVTATETNNEYFSLYKSNDGINFNMIYNTPGAGNSTITLNYSYIDDNNIKQLQYYKLKQTDYDGLTSESNIIAVESDICNSNIIITKEFIKISVNNNDIDYRIIITDMCGKIIVSKYLSGVQSVNMVNTLSSGLYSISIITKETITTKRFLID
jgi:hypothetical protein